MRHHWTVQTSNYTHRYWTDEHGRMQVWCSEGEPWRDEFGNELDMGNCPHADDPDGGPMIVHCG